MILLFLFVSIFMDILKLDCIGNSSARRTSSPMASRRCSVGTTSYQHPTKKLWLSVYVDDFKLVGDKDAIAPMWKALMKSIDLEPPIPLQSNVYLGCKQEPESPDTGAFSRRHKCSRASS